MLLAVAPALAGAAPQRAVSVSLCADEFLLQLLPKRQIASVTHFATDRRHSNVAGLAKGLPLNRGIAEEIITLKPDLVLTNFYSARPAMQFLERTGIRAIDIGTPQSFAEIREQIRTLAQELDTQKQGEALIAIMDRTLSALPPASPSRPTAALLRPNGVAIENGPLLSEMFEKAGLKVIELPASNTGVLIAPLEQVVLAAPDILILESDEEQAPALAQALLTHPAIEAILKRARTITLPSRLWTCPGPQMAKAVAILARARASLEGR